MEQEYNPRFYMQRFEGISCPRGRRYRRYFGARRTGRGKRANVTLPDGYRGAMQTIAEWEASLASLDLSYQAQALREWLGQTDALIQERLVPLLSPTAEELAAEAEEAAREAEEEAREAAEAAKEAAEEAAAEAAAAEAEEAEDDDEDEDEDEDEEEDEDPRQGGGWARRTAAGAASSSSSSSISRQRRAASAPVHAAGAATTTNLT